jgi:hypothetical protein
MPRRLSPLLLVVCASLVGPMAAHAQTFIEHLEPPVLQRGKTTRVTVVGAHKTRATDLWTSLPAGMVKATPVDVRSTGSVFDVQVSAAAPVGLFGLRTADGDGLSNLQLCLIDDLPVRPAPDSSAGPVRVDLPCALWGRFREAAVDRFTIAVKAGQRVAFEAVGNRFGKEVDPLVTIRDAAGKQIAEHDNDPGLYFDLRFEHTFVSDGNCTIEIRDSRYHGHEHGMYVLRMGRFLAARVAVPGVIAPGRGTLHLPEINEKVTVDLPALHPLGLTSLPIRRPGDEGSAWVPVEVSHASVTTAEPSALTPGKGTPAQIPGELCGVLAHPGERHFFRVELAKGQAIRVRPHTRSLNSPVDPEVWMTDATGRLVTRANETPDEQIRMDYTAPAAGVYCIAVRDRARDGGPAFTYRLEVNSATAKPEVVAEVEGLTVPRDSYQAVPLTVVRDGYGGPLSLTLAGAPPGVQLSPSEIPAGVNSILCQLSAGPDTPLGLHTIQILASRDEPSFFWRQPAQVTVVPAKPLVDRQLKNVDLIPYTLREDQRRLPPVVAERLALRIIEAIPFTVELAESTLTLPRYRQTNVPLVMTRKSGFRSPITFTARGGQLGDKAEGRTRVYAEFPVATEKELKVNGHIHSLILTNLGKSRIEVLATAAHSGGSVTLIRAFELDTRTTFAVKADAPLGKMLPGESGKVRLTVERVAMFHGPIKIAFTQTQGFELPESVEIPAGGDSVDIPVKVPADLTPGRRGVDLHATAVVDGFEEEQRNRVEIEVVKPMPMKK